MKRILCLLPLLLPASLSVQAQCPYFEKITSNSATEHVLGISSDGGLWAWGYNFDGELGDGTNETYLENTPRHIGSGTDWRSIAAGPFHSLGIKSDGTLWAWGWNTYGQLGDGTSTDKNTPIQTAPVLPGLASINSQGISHRSHHIRNNDCALIAAVNNSSASELVTAKVWLETVPPGQYVKRLFEITPANNASSATGEVTLYFTQAEFNSFNAVNTMDLPVGPGDTQSIANLRIEKRGGTSSDNSGLPATYPGTAVTIDPEDADIVWNAAGSYWEVSFAVTGFSGFFAKTTDNVLPVRLLSFKARETENRALLQWQTTQEVNASHFDVERSTDAKQFEKIGRVEAAGSGGGLHDYTFTDVQYGETPGQYYYRLRMVDADGTFVLSRIESLGHAPILNVYPNPVATNQAVTIEAQSQSGKYPYWMGRQERSLSP